MKNSINKIIGIIFTIIFVITMMPSFTRAEEIDIGAVVLEKVNGDKIIYVQGFDKTEFKYAFSDNNNPEDASVVYTTCQTDSNGENIAFLEKDKTYQYMFVSDGENIKTIELNSLKSITEDEIEEIKLLTTKISVNTEETTSYSETKEDGTTVTTTVGKIVITDEKDYKYQYQLIEILDKNSSITKANKVAVELYEKLTELENVNTMYEKLNTEITIRDNYKQLLENATWTEVKDMSIAQPEKSQTGEKYIVLIQKLAEKEVVESDIQFMTCDREDDADVEYTNTTKTKTVEKKAKLPITGENLAIYIILGVVIVAIIVVIARMKSLKGKENGKH